jgi:hypothetical protein
MKKSHDFSNLGLLEIVMLTEKLSYSLTFRARDIKTALVTNGGNPFHPAVLTATESYNKTHSVLKSLYDQGLYYGFSSPTQMEYLINITSFDPQNVRSAVQNLYDDVAKNLNNFNTEETDMSSVNDWIYSNA